MPRGAKFKTCHEPIFYGTKGTDNITFNVDSGRIPLDHKLSDLEKTAVPNFPTGRHPGRKAYSGTTVAKKYKRALDDKPYQMNENGRHPFDVIVPSVVNVDVYNNCVFDVKKPRGKKESLQHHQTQKPVALMEYLIKIVTNEEDIIVDCFGGTGTTAVAAIQLNRFPILIEREMTYVQEIHKRLKRIPHGD